MRKRIRVNGILYEEVGRGRRGRRLNESKWHSLTKADRRSFDDDEYPDLPGGEPPRLYEREKGDGSVYAILSGCKTRWGDGYAIDVYYQFRGHRADGVNLNFRGAPFFKDDAENAEGMFDHLVKELDRLKLDGSDEDVSRMNGIADDYNLEADYWD